MRRGRGSMPEVHQSRVKARILMPLTVHGDQARRCCRCAWSSAILWAAQAAGMRARQPRGLRSAWAGGVR